MAIPEKLAELRAREKQAIVGTTIGAVGGALTGDKGKRTRAVARGAIKGLGADVGGLAGAGLGTTLGGLAGFVGTLPIGGLGVFPGAAIGGLTGAYHGGRFGYNAADSMLGPYKSRKEELRELLAEIETARNNKHLENGDSGMATEKRAAGWPKFVENANTWLQRATSTGRTAVNYHNLTALGAGLGGLTGALSAPKGKMLKRTLQGAGLGGVAGLGAGLGGQLGYNITPEGGRALVPAGLGGLGGALLGHALADKALNEFTDDTASGDLEREEQEEKELADLRAGLAKISAFKKANIMQNPMAQGALMGGAGSALAGGLAGFMAPGEEDTVDEYGNPVRKQRSRFGAAMRGALGAGIAGAGAGAAAGHFAPNMVSQGMNHLQNFGSDLAQRMGFGAKKPSYQPVTPYLPDTKFDPATRQPIPRPEVPSYPIPGMG